MPDNQDGRFAPLQGNRIVVAFNPIAGSGNRQSRVGRLVSELKQAGFDALVCPDASALPEVVRRMEQRGELRGVVTAGGDGTFSHVANCLSPDTPLAVFPLGTENLVARYLGQDCDPRVLAELFRHGRSFSLDAGVANGRLFTLMAGCGFDAEVVERVHRARRGHIRYWSYIKPIVDTIRTYAYPRLNVEVTEAGGSHQAVECCWAFVVNVPGYAFGIKLDPGASPCDGLLNVVTFREGSLYSALRYLGAVLMGSHLEREGVGSFQATGVRIAAAGPSRYQVDGDPGGEMPLEIRCQPARLRVLVSPEWVRRNAPVVNAVRSTPAAEASIAGRPSSSEQAQVN